MSNDTKPHTVDWTGIRSVYRKLDEEFHVLTDGFGLYVPPQVREDMRHLIVAIDCVDRVLDGLPDATQRVSLSQVMIAYLRLKDASLEHPAVTAELDGRLANLKKVVWANGIVEPFSDAIAHVLETTESKRHVEDLTTFLTLVEQEGEYTAQLPLSIMGGYASQDFRHFFTRFCALMGIADLLFDARTDYKEGQSRIRPGFRTYGTVFVHAAAEGIGLLRQFPRKLAFIGYCFRFVGVLLRGS